MKHAKISILALLAVFVLSVPVFAIVEEPAPTPPPPEPVVQEPAPTPTPTPPPPQQQQQVPTPTPVPTPAPGPKPDPKRVQACKKRQAQIQNKTAKYVENAEKYQAVVDKLFERVDGFYESGQLTVDNYGELKTAAEVARAQAQKNIGVLKALGGAVDCTSPDVATQGVQAFRGAAGDAKTQLRNYSTSIKNMISAMQSEYSNANGGGE